MRDLPGFIAGLQDYIGKAVAPLRALIDQARDEFAKFVNDAEDRFNQVEAKVAEIAAREPQKGDKGEDGPTLEDVMPPLLEAARGLVAPLADEFRADASALKAEGDALRADLEKRVADAIAAIPEPAAPLKGDDGKSVTLDEVLAAVMPTLEKTMSDWQVQAERRFFDFCQKAVENMPRPKDGVDALGLADADLEFDGRRSYVLTFRNDEREIRKEIKLPAVLDAGFWNVGQNYEAGDGVTCGGSYWIAQVDTSSRPDPDNPDWRKAVSKGRDARMVELPKREPQPVKLGVRE